MNDGICKRTETVNRSALFLFVVIREGTIRERDNEPNYVTERIRSVYIFPGRNLKRDD
jgi:hypothetical protein